MSRSLVSGLLLLETIAKHEPVRVSEAARALGIDKSRVSRLLATAEQEGWAARIDGRYILGPRAAALGHGTVQGLVVERARTLVHILAGVTGLRADAYQLTGQRGFVLASATGDSRPPASWSLGPGFPLWALGGGKALAAQLDDDALDVLLPPDPLPAFTGRTVRDRTTLDRQLAEIRSGEPATDWGEFDPQVACLARPWSTSLSLATALTLLGPPEQMRAREDIARLALSAAVLPGATRASIIAAAAQVTPTIP